MSVLQDKTGHANIRHVILTFIILIGLAVAFLYYPPIPTRTAEELTQGDITFTDSAGDPINGAIGISGSGISGGYKENVNFIKWDRIPNGIVYFDALVKKNISVKFRLARDSRNSNVIIENYGVSLPKDLKEPAPGVPVKYVQVSAFNLSFVEAEISIQYNASELGDVDENSLSIYHYDIAAKEWSRLKTKVDTEADILIAAVDSLSIFAVSARLPGQIDIRDTRSAQVAGDFKTYDNAKNLKKSGRSNSLVAQDIPPGGELEVDAIASRNVAIRLKDVSPGMIVNATTGGEVIFEDYGRKNPVNDTLPGRPVKFVEIGVQGISFSSAQVSVHYREAELNGVSENSLVIYHWNLTYWEALDTTVDTLNNILTASTTTLSPFAVSGSTGGPDRILVATNRYVILDDPMDSSGGANASSGYALPFAGEWGNKNVWRGNQTTVGVSTLFIDNNGKAISGRIVNFTIYDPNNSIVAAGSKVTDTSGLAYYYKDMDNASFYGVWKVKAESNGVSSNATFIYNWWGCAWGTTGKCGGQHSGKSPADMGAAAANSPYTASWERTTSANTSHNINMHLSGWADDFCTVCHQSYDGNPTTSNIEGNTTKDFFVNDVHKNISCTNAACHDPNGTSAWNDHNTGNITIGSCDNCHDRTDISKKSTLDGVISRYSNGSGTYDKYHTPNATVPCIICHGPMHNISKPDAAAGSQNNVTEDTQCTACHSGYSRHNNSVNCTLCHSSDVHYIQVFGAATYVFTSSPVRGDCTTCHQNSTFMDALKSLPKAGNYTGRNAPQVPVPAAHSDDSKNGSKWNQTRPYWTNTSQIERCKYCHGETMHRAGALGRPSLFSGGNPVNGTVLSTLTWCQQCHWQGSPDYSYMTATFNEDNRTVPPEITGNATYGNVTGIGTAYINHSSYAKNDANCRSCHGNLAIGGNITGFMHSVAVGTSGGVNCTNCHNTGGTANNVNFSALSLGMHSILNSGAVSTPANANNRPCWACHGSKNGTWANESDQAVNEHNISIYNQPRKCYDCHTDTGALFGAGNVTDHIPSGLSPNTDVNTSYYGKIYCSYCHNNSLIESHDASMGVSGGSPENASVSHYGLNRTAGRLMSPSSNSTDCVFCHRNSSNMQKWGIIPGSRANISNKNASGGGTDHSAYTISSSCPSCHGNYAVTGGFTFHNSAVGKGTLGGSGGNSDCIGCHDIGGSATSEINVTAMRLGNHRNLNRNATNSTSLDPINKACWACHGYGTDPGGHSDNNSNPGDYRNPWKCVDCHSRYPNFTSSNFTLMTELTGRKVIDHIQQSHAESIYTDTYNPSVNCTTCHNKSKVSFTDSITPADPVSANVSHYSNYSDLITPSKNCTLCHQSPANASSWYANLTRHPAKSQNYTFCANCHNSSTIVTFHNQPLVWTPTIHGFQDNRGFDWEGDDATGGVGGSLEENNESCAACHSGGLKRTCENCHMPNTTSQFTGPFNPGGVIRKDINDTLPYVYSHINYSDITGTGVDVPNQNNPRPATSCYYYDTGTNAGTCHGNSYFNRTPAGGFYAFRGLSSVRNFSDPSHRTKTIDRLPDTTDCLFCHAQGSASIRYAWGSPFQVNATNMFGNRYSVSSNGSCYLCHTRDSTKPADFHSATVVSGGGPGCLGCHNTSSPQNYTGMHYIDGGSFSRSVHANLNSNNASGYGINASCWACHNSTGTAVPDNMHPDRKTTPYSCEDCHLVTGSRAGAYNATIVEEHFPAGQNIRTSGAYSNLTSCINCHNRTEMLVQNLDADTGTFDSDGDGSYGGNNSIYHYGRKRNDLRTPSGTDCSYCHQNSSTAFVLAMTNITNRDISNHSGKYSGSNPSCTQCHNTGWIHNSSLTLPSLSLPNSSYCLDCHGITGTNATIKNLELHNNSVNCTQCHLNTSSSIHPVRYLTKNGWETTSTNAVNCTDCHQSVLSSNFSNAAIIPSQLKHSSNTSNGSIWGTYWISESGSCYYCHDNTKHSSTPLGRIRNLLSPNNTRNGDLATTTWCANCHYNATPYYNGSLWNPVPPLITYDTGKPGWIDHSSYLSSGFKDTNCKLCHALNGNYAATSLNYSHSLDTGVAGGPDCISCHNTGGSAGSGRLVNFSAMNTSGAIHSTLNINAPSPGGYSSENKKCWACHGMGSEPALGGHPSRYDTPYTCENCHIEGTGQNRNFTPSSLLNVTQHYWNGSNIRTSAAVSCYSCHNTSEMMTGNFDPDGAANVYGGINGGNTSVSHYGKKRTDYPQQGTNEYCYRCHNNESAYQVFPYTDLANATIANHSTNYNSTNPGCSSCHASGRLHNSTLFKPAINTWPNSSYCITCHGAGGSAGIKNLNLHNGYVNCTSCHMNSSRNIHPVSYLQTDLTWNTAKSNAVNCTDCHQKTLTGFTNAPLIPGILKHSYNPANGSIWNSTSAPYWTSGNSPCYYCHSNTKHNNSGLGTISSLLSTANTRNGALTGTQWCADCHYNDPVNTFYKGDLLNPVPPLVTVNNTGKTAWTNHTSYLTGGFKDTNCKLCHALNGSYAATSLNYSHSLNVGISGGPNCTQCHNTGGSAGPGRLVNFSAMNASGAIHSTLNINAPSPGGYSSENKKCWACHGTGSEPAADKHPSRYDTPYTCENCHIEGTGQNRNFTPSSILNVTQHYWNGSNIRTSAAVSCNSCHNASEMMTGSFDPDGAANVYGGINGGNTSVSHYGKKRSDYPQQGTNEYCYMCHNNNSAPSVFPYSDIANATIANHSTNYNSTNPGCSQCHNTSRIHNSTLSKPSPVTSSFCLGCHGTAGTNATIKNLEKHNNTLDCAVCHMNSTTDVHPVKYRQKDNNTFLTSKTNAIDCTICHQGAGFANAPVVRSPLAHSQNPYNGSLWGNFWQNTSQLASCNYCHTNSSLHNASGLGRVSQVQYENTKNQSLSGHWCANCHYNSGTYSNVTYRYGGTAYSPVPPNISELKSVKAADGTSWFNHTFGSYADAKCKECHGSILSAPYSSKFMHEVSSGQGGPNCIGCHDIGGSATSEINVTAVRLGNHRNLNRNATNTTSLDPINKACWACHGYGTDPGGHSDNNSNPGDYRNPWKCVDCHSRYPNFTSSNFTLMTELTGRKVIDHIQQSHAESIYTDTYNPSVNCTTCHNKSKVSFTDSITPADPVSANVSHYSNYSDLITPSKNCTLCHQSPANASSWYANLTRHPAKSQNYTFCANCHNSSTIVTFHNQPLVWTPTIHGFQDNRGFDWEGDDATGGVGGSLEENNESCAACHSGGLKRTCENCHMPNTTSQFTGPFNPGGVIRKDINDTLPYVYSHINYSDITGTGVDVPNQNNPRPATSCYYYDTGTNAGTCHGNSYFNRTPAGGFYAFRGLSSVRNFSDPSHRTKTIDRLPDTTDCLFCHAQGSASIRYAWGSPFQVNATNMFGNRYSVSSNGSCYLCHTRDSTKPADFHSATVVSGGGPGCLGCHNTSSPQNYTGMHYIDGGSFSRSVHANLNSNNASGYGINASCWACHNSTGTAVPDNMHPDRKTTPYSCEDCHLVTGSRAGAYNATIISSHFRNSTGIRALTNSTSDLASCIECHENVSGMLLPNNDGDTGSFAGDMISVTGGRNSSYHYSKSQLNFGKTKGSNDYCTYCHRNATGEFNTTFIFPSNSSISNHSTSYNASNPSCGLEQCHNSTGATLHGNGLIRPSSGYNSTYCLMCHGKNSTTGLANYSGVTTAAKSRHNNSVNCEDCHMNDGTDIHPVKYLQPEGVYNSSNSTAVNCVLCHQTGMAKFQTLQKYLPR